MNFKILFLTLISNYNFINSFKFDSTINTNYSVQIPSGKDSIHVQQFYDEIKQTYVSDELLWGFIPMLRWIDQINKSNLTKFVIFKDLKDDCLSRYLSIKKVSLLVFYQHLFVNFVAWSLFLNNNIRIVFESASANIIIYKIP